MKFTSHLRALLLALCSGLLVACGDDGGFSGGGNGGGGETPPTGSEATVARIIFTASAGQLLSSAVASENGVVLSARALNASGNVIPNPQGLRFSIPSGSGELLLTDGEGVAPGTLRAILTTGGDPTARVIPVRALAGGISEQIDIPVVGTVLNLQGPSSIAFDQDTSFSVRLVDAEGNGIGGRTVSVTASSGTISAPSLTTAAGTGEAVFTLRATGNVELQVSALGLTVSRQIAVTPDQFTILSPAVNAEPGTQADVTVTVQWLRSGNATDTAGRVVNFSSTRGSFVGSSRVIVAADGRASAVLRSSSAGGAVVEVSGEGEDAPTARVAIEFVAATPSAINVQASPSTISVGDQSLIIATLRDALGNLVKNQVVDFSLNDVSGGSLSAPSATTNSQGQASVIYLASSSTTSADDGVRVVASVRSNPAVNSETTLTVGGRALRITLGTGNEIVEPNMTTYAMPYSVLVTDAAGNPVNTAEVRLSVLPVAYAKGRYGIPVDEDGNPVDTWVPVVEAVCENEDLNYNGVLDPGEDFNGNGTLEPGNVASAPTTVVLDENGAAEFSIVYPQDRASWVQVQLRATVRVQGTETTETARFFLPISAADVSDTSVSPPGAESPYGIGVDCADPG